MRKMIVWLLMLCLAISMAACHISLSGASGERDNDSEKQTEQDPEKSTGGNKEPTLPDSGFFPWGKPNYPEDPFLWITPETTLDELLAVLGEPTEYDNGNLTEPKYEGYVLYGQSGELWFEFEDDGTLREAGFAYEYPGLETWVPQSSDDEYMPSGTEVETAENYVHSIREAYLESMGEPIYEFNNSMNRGWRWALPNGVPIEEVTAKIELIINQEFQFECPVEIYYAVREE